MVISFISLFPSAFASRRYKPYKEFHQYLTKYPTIIKNIEIASCDYLYLHPDLLKKRISTTIRNIIRFFLHIAYLLQFIGIHCRYLCSFQKMPTPLRMTTHLFLKNPRFHPRKTAFERIYVRRREFPKIGDVLF